ncbi:MAG: DUF4906 domain-containing protein, partial [Rikenella sp.]|nr:DUF4906 domain-containing protein [Rikenella sp.]
MRRLFLFVAAGAMALGVSCNKSELQQPDDPNISGGVGGVGEGDTPVQVTLSTVSMSGSLGTLTPVSKSDSKSMSVVYSLGEESEDGVATKAATVLDEETVDGKVHDLWAVQFNSAGNCVAADYVSGSEISQTNDKVTAMVTLVADAGTGNTVYFVANTGDANLFKAYPGSSTNTKTTFDAASKAVTTELQPTAAGGIMMRGVYTGAVSEAAISAANVKLERLMAKVTLTYSIGSELNTNNFKVESVRLRSVANKIYYCGTPTGKTVWPEAGNHVDYPAETLAATPNSGTFTWYIPQNLQTSVKTSAASTATAAGTYIEIVGQCGLHDGNQVYYYIPVGSDGVTGTPKYDVKMNNKYTITVVLKGDNTATDARVERQPWSYSNCVMVAPGGKAYVSMPNRYTAAKAAGLTLAWAELAGTDYKVMEIWREPTTTATTLKYNKETGRIDVTAGTGQGNVLIGLFPSSATSATGGNCIWSWQVWVTNYRPDGRKSYGLGINSKASESGGEVHTYGTSYSAKVLAVQNSDQSPAYSSTNLRVMMDRNLGATAALYDNLTTYTRATRYPTYGLFYQWGRPTPFPKAGDADVISDNTAPSAAGGTNVSGFPVLVAGPKSVADAIKTPQNFYYNAASPYDWTTPQNNALWGDGAKKTVYDPCPDGWRIAPNGTWDDFGTSWGSPFSKLSNWSSASQAVAGGLYSAGSVKAFYPAPGFRDSGGRGSNAGGTLYSVGSY